MAPLQLSLSPSRIWIAVQPLQACQYALLAERMDVPWIPDNAVHHRRALVASEDNQSASEIGINNATFVLPVSVDHQRLQGYSRTPPAIPSVIRFSDRERHSLSRLTALLSLTYPS